MSNTEQIKYDYLGKKIQSDQAISEYPFKQDNRLKARCHLCSNDQVYLYKCFKCQTHFCFNCINIIKRTDENLNGNWVCFVCRKECPCQNCKVNMQSNQEKDKACLICHSMTTLCRVDPILDKIPMDEQMKKRVIDNQWIAVLYQSNGNKEKYLCENCINQIMPCLINNMPNKQEQRQGYGQQQMNTNNTNTNTNQGQGQAQNQNVLINSRMLGLQPQFFSDNKGMMPMTDQGFPIMNNQYPSISQTQGMNQPILNEQGHYRIILNDFNSKIPDQIPSVPFPFQMPPMQGLLNPNAINQSELNSKVLLMIVYEFITVFFNETLRHTTNILENTKLLMNILLREVTESKANCNEKNITLEKIIYKTAEDALKSIMSIQIYHEQIKKLILISLTPQDIANKSPFITNFNPNTNLNIDNDFFNFFKAEQQHQQQQQQQQQQFILENIIKQSMLSTGGNNGNYNQMAPATTPQPLNQNEKLSSPKNMENKPQQGQSQSQSQSQSIPSINQMNNQQQPSINFYPGPLNAFSQNQQMTPNELANLYISQLQQNQPKQQQINMIQPMTNNVNGFSPNSSSIVNQNMLLQSKQPQQSQLQAQAQAQAQAQDMQQLMQNNLMQMFPEGINQSTLMQFQKLLEQKQNDNSINPLQFKK